MGTKIRIKDEDPANDIELVRGVQIPREGEILILTKRGETEEGLYSIWSVEHTLNMNSRAPMGSTLITVVPVPDEEENTPEFEVE